MTTSVTAVMAPHRRGPMGNRRRPRVLGFLVGSVVYKSKRHATMATSASR